jgi:nitrogen regulatory protein PII-like uncharacterized protein
MRFILGNTFHFSVRQIHFQEKTGYFSMEYRKLSPIPWQAFQKLQEKIFRHILIHYYNNSSRLE